MDKHEEAALALFDRLRATPDRYRVGESHGVDADLRLFTACLRAVREPERADDIIRTLHG